MPEWVPGRVRHFGEEGLGLYGGGFRAARLMQIECYACRVEKVVIKRPLESEGIPPLIEDPRETLEVIAAILERGALLYPDADGALKGHPRVCRVIALGES